MWALLLLASRNINDTGQRVSFMGEAQGTYYSIIYYDKQARDFQPQVDSLLMAFDMSVSMWKPQSIISRINNNDTAVVADRWFEDIFNMAVMVSEATDGAFDMTIGPLVNAWGFGLSEREEMDAGKVDSLLQYVDYQAVSLEGGKVVKKSPDIKLDFNAIAQGYSVDVISAFLEGQGLTNYLVDIGGEIYARGKKPGGVLWKVAIEQPAENKDDGRALHLNLGLKDKAMATSGNYRSYYETDGVRYSHTIDPHAGYPVTHTLLSVTVISGNCALADAYATAFMVMGVEKARAFLEGRRDLQAYFISSGKDGGFDIYATDGFGE